MDFVFAMIAQIKSSGCIDPARIHVHGWSEGAYMAQRIACGSGDPAVDMGGVALAAPTRTTCS